MTVNKCRYKGSGFGIADQIAFAWALLMELAKNSGSGTWRETERSRLQKSLASISVFYQGRSFEYLGMR